MNAIFHTILNQFKYFSNYDKYLIDLSNNLILILIDISNYKIQQEAEFHINEINFNCKIKSFYWHKLVTIIITIVVILASLHLFKSIKCQSIEQINGPQQVLYQQVLYQQVLYQQVLYQQVLYQQVLYHQVLYQQVLYHQVLFLCHFHLLHYQRQRMSPRLWIN